MTKKQIISVQNAEGDATTKAEIIVQNKIDYTPKVSVIIPVYNVEQYLKECMDSVVNQTLKEIEIICVDDGSTDSSLEILKEYAKKDNRITVITQKNLHAGVARNAGLSVAKGEYLSFLDSDDFFELNMLEEMYAKAKKDDSDIVVCMYRQLNCLNNKIMENLGTYKNKLKKNKIFFPKKCRNRIFQVIDAMPWNKLFKHEHIISNNIKFQSVKFSNDFYFVLSAVVSSKKISYIPNNFITYTIFRENSLSKTKKENPTMFLYGYFSLKNFLESHNYWKYFKHSFYDSLYRSIIWHSEHYDSSKKYYNALEKFDYKTKFAVKSLNDMKLKGRVYPKFLILLFLSIEKLFFYQKKDKFIKEIKLFYVIPLYKREKSDDYNWKKIIYIFGFPFYIVHMQDGIKKKYLLSFRYN